MLPETGGVRLPPMCSFAPSSRYVGAARRMLAALKRPGPHRLAA